MATAPPVAPPDLETIRSWFPVTRELVYLYNGNINACPTPVRAAMEEFLEVWSRGGDACWEHGWQAFEQSKALFAALVNTDPTTLCSIPNTSTGISLAAQIVAPRPGQNVVVEGLSHPSNVYPWLLLRDRGVEVRVVPPRDGRVLLEDLDAAIDAQTAALHLCLVSMGNGFRFNLSAVSDLGRARGVPVVVDAAQAAGAIPIDLRAAPVDFLATPTFKWLLGPLGNGFLHVRPDWIERASPPQAGWMSVDNPLTDDFDAPVRLPASAMRFERGSIGLIGYAGARAGLELLRSLGHAFVMARIAANAERVYRGLARLEPRGVRLWTPPDPGERAGIVAFTAPRREALYAHLESRRIHAGDWLEHIRVDASFYNSDQELDLFLSEVEDFLSH